VSLTTILEAFVLVAVLFNAAALLSARDVLGRPSGAGASGSGAAGWRGLTRRIWPAATAEAFVLTLFAALWFGSLGHGGWLLVFLLVGALAAGGDRWLRHRLLGTASGSELRLFAAGLVKYLLAGLVLAWRLS
jgi:hypothetical protein